MKIDETKIMLAAPETESVLRVYETAVGELLDPYKPRANVRGIGVGVKWRNGQPTGEPAVLVLVTHKFAKEQLGPGELVPAKFGDMQTDVLAIGEPFAGGQASLDAGTQTLTKRVRPAGGGYSVGHKNITAGTSPHVFTTFSPAEPPLRLRMGSESHPSSTSSATTTSSPTATLASWAMRSCNPALLMAAPIQRIASQL